VNTIACYKAMLAQQESIKKLAGATVSDSERRYQSWMYQGYSLALSTFWHYAKDDIEKAHKAGSI
jgi:hypothetical protein